MPCSKLDQLGTHYNDGTDHCIECGVAMPMLCSIPGCTRMVNKKELCGVHGG